MQTNTRGIYANNSTASKRWLHSNRGNKILKHKIVIILMSALLFTACNKAEVVPPSISKQKPKETVIWDSNSKSSISQQEYDNAILAYIKSKYPQKVKAYELKQKKNTLILGNLMWQDNSDTKRVQRTWNGAKEYCRNLSLLGFSDWRLGNKDELKSLYQYKSKLKYFIDGGYWSSSGYNDSADYAWGVGFYSGTVSSNNKSYMGFVRCVRDGQ